jgi:hypothetical protein
VNNVIPGESKLTELAIGHIVLDILKDIEINLKFCIDIGTDRCCFMTSCVVIIILKECPITVQFPCFNNVLNISYSYLFKVASVRNTIKILKEVIMFFNGSAKR